jgi:four helix bundle protein
LRHVGRRELSSGVQRQIAREWIAKIGLVVEEADQTVFWLEMLSDCGIVPSQRCEDILKEARELSAIFTATQHTARRAG